MNMLKMMGYLKVGSFINKIKFCLCILFLAFCCNNDNHNYIDIVYITADELLTPKNKGLLRLNEAIYKNCVFQISGNIIFKQQAKDNSPQKNKSCVYFGERTSDNNLVWGKIIICYFDVFIYDSFSIGDHAIIQGRFKKIQDDGDIIFEKCQIVKPTSNLELP